MAIGRRPFMSFAIANNLLAPSTKATNLRIPPRVIATTTWNNSESTKDGSSGMKQHKRCSYTILESPPENKWGAMGKAWVNKVLFRTKMCLG
jgi:hypothetical protein